MTTSIHTFFSVITSTTTSVLLPSHSLTHILLLLHLASSPLTEWVSSLVQCTAFHWSVRCGPILFLARALGPPSLKTSTFNFPPVSSLHPSRDLGGAKSDWELRGKDWKCWWEWGRDCKCWKWIKWRNNEKEKRIQRISVMRGSRWYRSSKKKMRFSCVVVVQVTYQESL